MAQTILIFLVLGLLWTCAPLRMIAQTSQPQRGYSSSESYFPNLSETEKSKKSTKDKKGTVNSEGGEGGAQLPLVSVDSSSIWLSISILDKKGNGVSGIAPKDIEIFIDEKEQKIEQFEAAGAPPDVIFLIDTSPSFNKHVGRVQDLIKEAVLALRAEARVSLVSFNGNFEVLLGLTTERKAVIEALTKLRFDDGTSLYDAVDRTVLNLEGYAERPRNIVLVTDGVDTSSNGSFTGSLTNTYRSNSIFWSVYLNTFNPSIGSLMSPGSQVPTAVLRGMPNSLNEKEYRRGREYLTHVVRMTGGRSFDFPRRDSQMSVLAAKLGNAIESRYVVRLEPEALDRNVRIRRLRVRVAREDLQILVKSGLSF